MQRNDLQINSYQRINKKNDWLMTANDMEYEYTFLYIS